MDIFPRSRRAFLSRRAYVAIGVAASASALVACVAKSMAPVGVSDVSPGRALSHAGDASADAGVSPVPRDFRATFSKINATRVPSIGHAGGRWDIDVYANPAGKEALSRGIEMKDGAMIVVEHFERSADHAAGPRMAMEKMAAGYWPEHHDVRYVSERANGELVAEGRLESCAGCHDDAPAYALFPVKDAPAPTRDAAPAD